LAAVRIDIGPVEADDRVSSVPRERWHLLVGARRSFLRVNLPYDCRQLLRFVRDAEVMYMHLGYSSVDDFVRRGLEVDPGQVDWAIKGLKLLNPDQPVAFADAVNAGLSAHGGQRPNAGRARKDKPGNQVDTINLKTRTEKASGKGGTSREYRLARLERDGHQKLAASARAREISVAAAWRAAGLEKPPDPVREALRWVAKMDGEQRRRFLDQLEQER